MEAQAPEQAEITLHSLANAANAQGERDVEAAAPGPSAVTYKKTTQYQPITDETELAALRVEGLTDKGHNKVTKGDLRCRPPRVYSETFFDKKLPQFRLKTVADTARSEDIVMVWAYVTGRDTKLRKSEFRFSSEKYLNDPKLVKELKELSNSSDGMVAYLKAKFGTLREPKKEPEAEDSEPEGEEDATDAQPDSIENSEKVKSLPPKAAELGSLLVPKTAHAYLREFRDSMIRKKTTILKKAGSEPENGVHLKSSEEKECDVRALHKAAWDGQAKAAFDLATRIKWGDGFNAMLKFNYTPLHQTVLGSVGSKRTTNMRTAERLIEHGADVDAQDIFGRTPLHHASRRGNIMMMDLLLSKGADPEAAAHNGSTPLHCAAESGGVAAVQKLLVASMDHWKLMVNDLKDWMQVNGCDGKWPRQGITVDDAREVRLAMFLQKARHGRKALLAGETDVRKLHGMDEERLATLDAQFPGWCRGETPLVDTEISADEPPQCGTALLWAARAGQDEVVDLLLKAGFDANARDWHGTTPLQAAAREYKDVFPDRLKIGDYRSFIRQRRKKNGQTAPPLRKDKGDDYLAVVRYLLGYGADREAVDNDNRTALHVAAACGNLKCVKLLRTGAALDGSMQNDSLGFNPFMLSVIKSEPDSILAVNEQSSVESTEYWDGAQMFVIEGKVNDNKDNRGRTALHLAALAGRIKVVDYLLKQDANVDAKDDNGATPLLLAARAQQSACAELLLNNGADPNIKDNLGCSSLSAAALVGDLVTVELLLKHGAEVDLENRSENDQAGDGGRTALHDAAGAGNLHVVEYLINQNANFNHQSDHRKTPLHVAARYGNTDVVQALIAAGSDISLMDCKGRTALQIAEQYNLDDVVEVLKQAPRASATAAAQAGQQQPASEQQQQHHCGDAPEDVEYSDWQSRFILLNEFAEVYKRVPAPDEWFKGYPLGSWVELQKEKLRWDEMPEDEFAALGAVALKLKDWGAGIPWMDWLQNVKEYVAANDKLPSAVAPKDIRGKEPVSQTGDVDKKVLDLGWWCKFQQCRKAGMIDEKKNSSLDDGQIKELEALRQWRWESHRDRQNRRVLLSLRLNHFVRKYKRLPRPDDQYLGVPLGKWCEFIRKLKLRSDLPKERQNALERCVQNLDGTEIFEGCIHALWNHPRPSLDDYIYCLNSFVREHRRIPTTLATGANSMKVGSWLTNQKQKWKKGKLAAEVQRRIEEVFSNHKIEYQWASMKGAAGKDGGQEEVAATAVAVVDGDEMKEAEINTTATLPVAVKSVDATCAGAGSLAASQEATATAAAAVAGPSSVAALPASQKGDALAVPTAMEILDAYGDITDAKRETRELLSKAAEGTEPLAPIEVLHLITTWEAGLATTPRLFKPGGGCALFLVRSSKLRQDGHSWDKEYRSDLKVNGKTKLKCCYAVNDDGTLQRRIYWELERPDPARPDYAFIHYINKQGASVKRNASKAELDAKDDADPYAGAKSLLLAADQVEGEQPSTAREKRAKHALDTFNAITDPGSDDEMIDSELKRRKRRSSGKAEAVQLPPPPGTEIEGADGIPMGDGGVNQASGSAPALETVTQGGDTALISACQRGDTDAVRCLITAKGVDINAVDDKNCTALRYACKGGHEAIVKLLLDSGAEMNQKGKNARTCLMDASLKGNVAVVQNLLDKGANVNHVGRYGCSALLFAARGKHWTVVEKLLQAKADANARDEETGMTALMYAARNFDNNRPGSFPLAANDVSRKLRGESSRSSLIIPKSTPLPGCVIKQLVDAGAKLNSDDIKERTALIHACIERRIDNVEKLVDAGAKLELKDKKGMTALLHASSGFKQEANIIWKLLRAGADYNSTDKKEKTALIHASIQGHIATVDALLHNEDANLNSVDKKGKTALMHACIQGRQNGDTVYKLVTKGADVNIVDNEGRTALMYACIEGQCTANVQKLVDAGANLELKDNDGMTALMHASKGNFEYIVKVLNRAVASKDAKKKEENSFKMATLPSASLNTLPSVVSQEIGEAKPVIPEEVKAMVAEVAPGDYVAMVKALMKIGGPAMRWAVVQISGNKLQDYQKTNLFNMVKDAIERDNLQEAADVVNEFKDAL